MQTRCDYILSTDWRCFKMVRIRDVINYSLEHFTLWDRLLHPMEAGQYFGVSGLSAHI